VNHATPTIRAGPARQDRASRADPAERL